ncbi:hypothetical protein DMENIID0001_162180 [Sergentomyia squamirostris]
MEDADEEIPSFTISRTRDCSVLLESPYSNLSDNTNDTLSTVDSLMLRKGTLLWAAISGKSTFWPCILAEDVDEPEKGLTNIHVRFFGDCGRSGRISSQNIMEFRGREDFEAQKQIEMTKKTPMKNKGKFFVKSKQMQKNWDAGVDEAETFLTYPLDERMEKYEKLIEEQQTIVKEIAKKRKREREESKRNSKKFKFDLMDFPQNFSITSDSISPSVSGRSIRGSRKKSSELSESGVSTMGSPSPCPTNDLFSEGTATPIRVTPERMEKVNVTIEERFATIQRVVQSDVLFLFRMKQKMDVCRFCGNGGILLKCSGRCGEVFHANCQNINVNLSNEVISSEEMSLVLDTVTLCCECDDITVKKCFICHVNLHHMDDETVKCQEKHCPRWYHRRCLEARPQTKTVDTKEGKRNVTKFTCPQHICHICSSDDPQHHSVERRLKLFRCILCPSSYHIQPQCLPAGAEVLSGSHIICPKHWPLQKPVNANFCFICTKGGNLLCCDFCPVAVHEDCAKTKATDQSSYICDSCESGRDVLYGNIVWAKHAGYRWWPSITITNNSMPDSVEHYPHNRGDICIFFLGSNNYAWLSRKQMFVYQEDDSDNTQYKSYAKSYRKALVEANKLSQIVKVQNEEIAIEKQNKMIPPAYKKITKSQLVSPVKRKDLKVDPDDPKRANNPESRCLCRENGENCDFASSCFNRHVLMECTNENCDCAESCMNRPFHKQKYPKTRIVWTERCGWGLVADEYICTGDFVCEYIGEIINEEEVARRIRIKKEKSNSAYYFFTLHNGLTIDAEHKGNVSRYINHSCDPNCMTQKWTVNGAMRIGIFAIKDIPQGTELSFNYQWENRGSICLCDAPNCSGTLGENRQPKSRK